MSPNAGTTARGLGIGATREEVECAYGLMQRPAEAVSWYTAGGVLHGVYFEADVVDRIWLFDEAFFE